MLEKAKKFFRRKPKEKSKLDEVIDDRIALLDYSLVDYDADEDAQQIRSLKELVEVKSELEPKKQKVDKLKVAGVAAPFLLGIITLVWEERHVITSKVWNGVSPKFPKM